MPHGRKSGIVQCSVLYNTVHGFSTPAKSTFLYILKKKCIYIMKYKTIYYSIKEKSLIEIGDRMRWNTQLQCQVQIFENRRLLLSFLWEIELHFGNPWRHSPLSGWLGHEIHQAPYLEGTLVCLAHRWIVLCRGSQSPLRKPALCFGVVVVIVQKPVMEVWGPMFIAWRWSPLFTYCVVVLNISVACNIVSTENKII